MKQNSSRDKLIDATIALWEMGGQRPVSTRSVSAAASVPVASLYHHFGSMDRLYVLAQERAQSEARTWCEERLRQIAGIPTDCRAFPTFLAGLIDDWTQQQRRLAFVWREGQVLHTDSTAGAEIRAGWQRLWSVFWQEAVTHFGMAQSASVANRLFENESFMHMMNWRRAVDRAGLDEFAQGAWAWMTGEPVPASPWRDFACSQALESMPDDPDYDATTRLIANTAATLMKKAGPTGVTHRAVAGMAGLTLGVVSHKVRTKQSLLQLAYRAVYSNAIARLRASAFSQPLSDPSTTLDGAANFFAASLGGRSVDALYLAVARTPALRPFGLQLRYRRDSTARDLVQALFPHRPEPTYLDEAVLAGFLSSLVRSYSDSAGEEAREGIRAEMQEFVATVH